MTDALACNPLSAAFNHGPKKPLALILPALLFAIPCYGSVVAYVPTKAGCGGDTVVSVAQDGSAQYIGKGGEVDFTVLNKPTPKTACVTELNKEQSTAFAADRAYTWDVWNKEHNG